MVVVCIPSASEKMAPSHSFGTHGCVIGCGWDGMHSLIDQAHRCAQQTSAQEAYDAPRNEQVHTLHTGEFHPSLHPFFIPFISTDCRQGLCTNRGTDTETH